MGEAHVDNIIRYSQEDSRWSAEDLGSQVVSWFYGQVWPLHRRPFGKPELAVGGNCSELDVFSAGHGRSVLTAACLAVSRYLATAGLFDGT